MIGTVDIVNSFILGLAASFAPCLFPVLPSFVAFLTQSETKRSRGLLSSILVTAGIMTVFIILALLINLLGGVFLSGLSRNYVNFRIAQGIILVFLGILLTSRLKLNSNRLNSLINRIQGNLEGQKNPWIMSYSLGLFFTILAAPCAFVSFGTFVAILLDNPGTSNAIGLTLFFSIGAGIPFLLMGILVPSIKEAFLDNQEIIFKYMPLLSGILIILTGGYLITDAIFGFSF